MLEIIFAVVALIVGFIVMRTRLDHQRMAYQERAAQWEKQAHGFFSVLYSIMEFLPGAYLNGQFIEWKGIRLYEDGSFHIEFKFTRLGSERHVWRSIPTDRLVNILKSTSKSAEIEIVDDAPPIAAEDQRLGALFLAAQMGFALKAQNGGGIAILINGKRIGVVNRDGIWATDPITHQRDMLDIDEFRREMQSAAKWIAKPAEIPASVDIGEPPL